ncbi:DISARM system phospholipase D-like protein DrmC [Actinoplanes sp. NPDC049118]|uniref:DISARM system phospholipase D-like protein DrmC n=1 Tax=Actinoplanes sp. NPDC049118 TaxID=3155769 RepID=UPI0033E09B5F
MPNDPYAALGAYLDGTEAARLAAALREGWHTTKALEEISKSRRDTATTLLKAAQLGHDTPQLSSAVLQGIAGARGPRPDGTIGRATVTPVWTMPGAGTKTGRLTSEARRMVEQARTSVVCSSYNFGSTSEMWTLLREASTRPGVAVSLYLDTATGQPAKAATDLPHVTVWATQPRPGEDKPITNHAKFVIVDRALILLTSANFSYNAEHRNIELGLLVHDTALAASIQHELTAQHGKSYALASVPGPTT